MSIDWIVKSKEPESAGLCASDRKMIDPVMSVDTGLSVVKYLINGLKRDITLFVTYIKEDWDEQRFSAGFYAFCREL